MIKIAVVDDEEFIVQLLQKILEEILAEKSIECKIRGFASGQALLDSSEDYNLVFLDLEMPEMDGIQAGMRLREIQPDCTIILATANRERFKEGFLLQALRYVTKPFEKEEIEEAIQAYMDRIVGQEELNVFLNRMECHIPQRDVQYIEAYNGYTLLCAYGRQYRSEKSLNEFENQLDGRLFFKIHRKYIVNMRFVEQYNQGKVILQGQKIGVSRSRQKDFELAYMQYDIQQGGLK